MTGYGIDFVAYELDVHPSSLQYWEETGLISPHRAKMGTTTLRIYEEDTMRLLRRATALMETGMSVPEAFGQAHDEIARRADKSHG
jgi:DNA-binding transcriptional MerR regulator